MPDRDLVPSGRHSAALSRAELMAQALRVRAREIIPEPARREILSRAITLPGQGDALRGISFGRILGIGFFVIFAVPALLAIIYFTFVASDQYVSEARFAVRTGERSALDQLAGASRLGQLAQAQDTLIVAQYVKSRSIVEALDKNVGLRAMYSRDDIDFIASAASDDSIEDLVDYWNWRVSVGVDVNSGIVTVTVRAFSAEDAQKIAQEILALSEALVNQMSARANHDELEQAEAEFKRAEDKLKEARVALRDLRNSQGVLDPTISAEALNELLTDLRKQELQAENDLIVMLRSISESAPQARQLKARIAALKVQIEKVEAQLTAASPGDGDALSETYGEFEDLELKRAVAESQYADASLALENARLAAERQRIYLNTIAQPEIAEKALYPLRFWTSLAIVVGLFLAWLGFAAGARFLKNALA